MVRQARGKWLTIPTRIVLGYVIVLVAFAVVGGLSFVQHHRTSQTLGLLEDGYLPLALTLSQAKATQSVYANLVERALESERSAPTKAWLRAALRIRPTTLRRAYEGVEKAEALATELGQPAPLRSVRRELDAIGEAYQSIDSQYELLFNSVDEDQDAVAGLLAKLRNTEQRIERNYDRAAQSVQQRISRTSALAAAQAQRATYLLGLLGLLALFVGVAVTFLSQRLLRPIPLLHQRVAAVARGDLSSTVDIKRNDELGQLVTEFERMVQALAARDQSLREAALAEQRLQRMQVQIVEVLRAAILVIDADRIIQTTNPAADHILGVYARDVTRPIDDTSLLRRCPALGKAITEVARGGHAVTLEGEPVAGFTERLVDVLVTPFGEEAGREGRRSVLVVAEDVSDAIATKLRLIQTERLAAIGRMAAHVTHEVRNPLSSIGLNVEMLGDEVADSGPEGLHLLQSIQQELERLESITEEYLRLARLPEPSLTPQDPVELLNEVAQFVQREMDAAGVELKLEVPSQLPAVAMDEPQFRQALLNLLRNAREAMPDGGVVKLEATRYDNGVRIQVHDEGPGIDEEEREHVFDLFYTTKERGTGLGLPLTQQIVVAHNGTIACKARHPRGTTFEIWLPDLDSTLQRMSSVAPPSRTTARSAG
ncbi:MAG: ATP-binding protein [Myxococcales bacterium]|jgi:signal transduction histidine kinase/methyl-accepting chemotaxis protein